MVVETDKGGLAVGLGVEIALVVETNKGGLSAGSVIETATEWDWASIAD